MLLLEGTPKEENHKKMIKTGNLDFENVYFVRELKFNLFNVSQMCDKKNSFLFNDTECIVLSPNFKLIDESQILLRVLRKNNMYTVDLKNIVPKEGLTCLFAKATSDESKLWHRRLVPPPYTGNFMPPTTPDLSFTGLDEFVNKPVAENVKAKSSKEEAKAVRNNDDALIIKEYVSDNEKENVSQPKIEKKTVRLSIVKKEFVKSRQQQNIARKIVKQVEQNRQNTHIATGNQRNWNNMMS
nr:ribonuclease H-like domain-containing protein [Tanacetum cinerariifolium]